MPRDSRPLALTRLRSVALSILFAFLVLTPTRAFQGSSQSGAVKFNITFSADRSQTPLDGRVILILATVDPKSAAEREPRERVADGLETQQIFGVDVENWKAGSNAVIDTRTLGYPLKSLAEVPPGTYTVQAVLHKYETFKRSDGHTVKLPMDRGEGQHWNLAPGNLTSKPSKITIEAGKPANFEILLDQEIPPITPAKDTKFIKHVRIQSERLTKFWGRPMYLGAVGSSRVDLQACKLEYSIVSPK